MNIKKILSVITIIMMLLVGCGQKTAMDSQGVDNEYIEDSDNETSDDTSMVEESNQEGVDQDKNNREKIASTSEIYLSNALEDGTLWANETDEAGQRYIVHLNVKGEILGKVLNEFDGYMNGRPDEYSYEMTGGGINESFFAIETTDNGAERINIYDINTLEDVSGAYIGEYDEIISMIQTEKEIVFVVRKIVESFEEKYACLKLINTSGEEIFDISLDHKTLTENYNIDRIKDHVNMGIEYAGNNVYYIGYIGSAYDYDKLNSLVIDL